MADSCRIESDVLIIGAGPFGLSLAARLAHLGVDYRIVGEPMGFWRHSMPAGMFLRSSWDWHLDPQANFTIERFLDEEGIGKDEVSPFPLATYLQYVEWFRRQSGIDPLDLRVQRLDSGAHGRFVVTCEDGTQIDAGSVVLALGFSHFPHVPDDLDGLLPGNRVAHTLEFVDLDRARDKSILLVGGRQSAFEWAALLCEAGAAEVHITHRHPSPSFTEADWSWVPPLMENMVENPAWFRELPESEKTELTRRLWGEGRLKVEPWLEQRFRGAPISIWSETQVASCTESGDGTVAVELSNGTALAVDLIVLATGYKADIARVGLLRQGNVFDRIETVDGLPVLDEHFQSSVPGLYMTSYLATRDFGPFFGFTVAAWAAARVLGDELGRAKGKGR